MPTILKYWNIGGVIHKTIQDILNVKFDLDPKYYLLSVRPRNLMNSMNDFFFYATTAARLLLAANWRQSRIPEIEEWKDKMRNYATISTLSRNLNTNKTEEYQDSWDIFFQYLSTSWSVWLNVLFVKINNLYRAGYVIC